MCLCVCMSSRRFSTDVKTLVIGISIIHDSRAPSVSLYTYIYIYYIITSRRGSYGVRPGVYDLHMYLWVCMCVCVRTCFWHGFMNIFALAVIGGKKQQITDRQNARVDYRDKIKFLKNLHLTNREPTYLSFKDSFGPEIASSPPPPKVLNINKRRRVMCSSSCFRYRCAVVVVGGGNGAHRKRHVWRPSHVCQPNIVRVTECFTT